ncbi:hypothetical protein LPKW2_06895 [Lactiplantibacillus pentosus]|nr:hypothetical protein LPKW2_06895 [Lactiplantibacillus pentosus]
MQAPRIIPADLTRGSFFDLLQDEDRSLSTIQVSEEDVSQQRIEHPMLDHVSFEKFGLRRAALNGLT